MVPSSVLDLIAIVFSLLDWLGGKWRRSGLRFVQQNRLATRLELAPVCTMKGLRVWCEYEYNKRKLICQSQRVCYFLATGRVPHSSWPGRRSTRLFSQSSISPSWLPVA